MEELFQVIDRKKVGSFFEKYLQYRSIDYSHDRIKRILYGEACCETKFEEKMKSYLDGFVYLLSNYINPVTKELLKKFFCIISVKLDESSLLNLSSAYFFLSDLAPIEKALQFHIVVYEELVELEEFDRLLISFLFMNFILVKNKIPVVCIFVPELRQYLPLQTAYLMGKKEPLWHWLYSVISKNKLRKKIFCNQEPIPFSTLYEKIMNCKIELMKNYHIRHLWIYGSYVKGNARRDSDIDMLVRLSLDLMTDRREQIIAELQKKLKDLLNRSVDIHQVYDCIPDELIKTTTKIKKIF